MKDKNERFEIKPEEALVDGLAFISQKLCGFIDGKRTNVMSISELLLRLAIPNHKAEVNSEDIFVAVEQVTSMLDSMAERKRSGLN